MKSIQPRTLVACTFLLLCACMCACARIRELEGDFFYSISFSSSTCQPETIQSIGLNKIISPLNPSQPLNGSCFERTGYEYGYAKYECNSRTATIKNLCKKGCKDCVDNSSYELYQCNSLNEMYGCGKLPDFVVNSEKYGIKLLWTLNYQLHLNAKDNQCGRTGNDMLVGASAYRTDSCFDMYEYTQMYRCNSTDFSSIKYAPRNISPQCTNFDSQQIGKIGACSQNDNSLSLCN
ncbi:hypothetical protein NAEGRDRAFT_82322 [Naegleria gruberi]|uniref:Lipoprotein n=1 Tax=Naegleria gruberi TaxID=5762 RepID=D2W4K7_NAEGR|nr:uncharacterized protein NAEGRDRAFT_82322 [Naegleria gruberi]EFC35997.1 hypothetical protein NAEGRDRAFT_82322 [Naegleria gruberi]|eukprot:XP_002668741.1 hypothetical protein NAEGRDRAFT_82322 [Naegleria gruberi strain NEG-M]